MIKKLMMIVAMMAAVTGLSAQEKGDFAVGLRGGASVTRIEIQDWKVDDTSARFGIGVFGQYNFANHWRVDLEGIYHPENDHTSDFMVGLNVHYLINLTKDHNFKLYPLLGYGLDFIHSETFTEGGTTVRGSNSTDGGIQLGLGLQANLGDNWFVAAEYKFQPGIFGDCHVPMASIGYRF